VKVAAAAAPTSAVGPSLAPAGAPLVQSPTELPNIFDSLPSQTAGNSDFVARAIGGVYGGAPQPAASVPASQRPAIVPPPSAEGAAGNGAVPTPEPTIEPEAAPGSPRDLVASVSGSTVTLKWGRPSYGSMPTGYTLEAGTAPGRSNLFVSATGSTAVSFTTPGAKPGTYFVRVRATNARGTSDPSNEATLIVGGSDSGPCTAPPSAPGGLRFSPSGSTVVLTWNAAQFAPTSYVVETASGPGGKTRTITDTHSAATTRTEDDLTPGTYVVGVRARNACGSSALSDPMTMIVR
jgi:predicted phage tail protein